MGLPLDREDIESRARSIEALVLDVDGVLTDGRVTYLPNGEEAKTFHVRDGLGMQLLQAAGVSIAIISGRQSDAVHRRAVELGVQHVYLGIDDKVATYDAFLKTLQLKDSDVAYIGDDLPDLALLRRVGLGFAVADAATDVRQTAHVCLRAGGGYGAVREACELILRARGAWRV